jgi:endogenous inhibitor of DNA gyrase (YacG/DUF329 family)
MDVVTLADWPAFPFCSERCRTIDLGRWLGERYRLPEGPEESADRPAGVDDEAVP